jgi:ssDNA-binding Zn-finger/Zn-ribbon topoisomerase 1
MQLLTSQVERLFQMLAALPSEVNCPKCGLKLLRFEATFFSAETEGKAWNISLPACPKCDLTEDPLKSNRRLPPMQTDTAPDFLYCVLCHKPVSIEVVNTDENGKPVHSECYAQSLARLGDDASPLENVA